MTGQFHSENWPVSRSKWRLKSHEDLRRMIGNKLLTLLSNMCTNLNLTDMETCSKVFRAPIIKQPNLRENRFGFEPEITAKVAKARCRIYEVGISAGRTYEECKKITWKDGIRAFYAIIKYIFFAGVAIRAQAERTGPKQVLAGSALPSRLKLSECASGIIFRLHFISPPARR
jgi:hypothetical protein